MQHVIAIDPGLRAPGCAVFEDKRLIWASCVHTGDVGTRGPLQWAAVAEAVLGEVWKALPVPDEAPALLVEQPQVYAHGTADPADLIELAASLGACVGMLSGHYHVSEATAYLPREWKGQIPKKVHHLRIQKVLTGAEEAALKKGLKGVPLNLRHNALDAVGIGLKYFGRIR